MRTSSPRSSAHRPAGPGSVPDESWMGREVHRARALLIPAATHHQTVAYGELSPSGHRRWYDRRVLGGVFDLCRAGDEPDLTALLVPAGEPPETQEEAEAVSAYRQERAPAR